MNHRPGAAAGESPIRHSRALVLFLAAAAFLSPSGPASSQSPAGYTIQVLAVKDSSTARRAAGRMDTRLRGQFPVFLQKAGAFHKVRVGDFPSVQDAQGLLRQLRMSGYPDAFISRLTAADLPADSRSQAMRARRALAASAPALRGSGPPPENAGAAIPAPMTSTSPPTAGRPPAAAVKRMQVVRVKDGAVRVDGRLDEEIWKKARFVTDFEQKGSDRGSPVSDPIGVSVAYDDRALYIAARMAGKDSTRAGAFVGRRDNPGTAERFLVSIDTYRDRRTAYTFGVTVGGVRVDYYHPQDDEHSADATFEPVWDARTRNTAAEWTAEFRIPFSQLRFRSIGEQVWGINFTRVKPGRDRQEYWVAVPMNETGWASRFGELTGLEIDRPASRIELLPYVAASGVFEPRPEGGTTRELSGRGGADLKFRLASNVTLDATVNPDFGQVEADAATVNLTAFETFFPERRPFFREGSQLLEGIGPTWFYSRRVGSLPGGASQSGYVDAPVSAAIPAAVKVTGRLNSGTSIAAMTALTAPERATVVDPAAGRSGRADVSPLTGYGVARVQQELGSSGSTAGLIVTGVHRRLSPGSDLASLLDRDAVAAGADWSLRFAGGTYEVTGYAGVSHIAGDTTALARAQRSSARYFQRPDADYVAIDGARTSLRGYTTALSLAKKGGMHWLWDVGASAVSPGFEINDAGAQPIADRVAAHATLRFRENEPGGELLGYQVALFTSAGWNFGGVRQYASPSIFTSATWRNLLTTYLQLGVDTRVKSDKLTRGGPLAGAGFARSVLAGLSTDYAARSRWSASAYYFRDEFSGRSYFLQGGWALRPSGGVEFSLDPGVSGANRARQFFSVIPASGTRTFGDRYVFSLLRRREFYLKANASFALNPDVTLELVGMPFASSARFSNFAELSAAGSRELREYGTDGTTITAQEDGTLEVTDGAERFSLYNADFNIRSFRINAVLRWEWLRGSTLFLIWQRNGFVYDQDASLVTTASLWNAVGDRVDNVIAAKLTYWLPFH